MRAQRAILFVGAGLETRPGIQRALDMGLHFVEVLQALPADQVECLE